MKFHHYERRSTPAPSGATRTRSSEDTLATADRGGFSSNRSSTGPSAWKAPRSVGGDMFAAVAGRSPLALQRTCDCGGADGCAECEKNKKPGLQRQADGVAPSGPDMAPPSVRSTIGGGGRSMPGALRGEMEERMGADFGDVRIHADSAASASARDVSARAYTVGSHVVFGAGMWRPETADGRHLLAHELTHVLQQRGAGAGTGSVQRSALPIAEGGSTLEREADRVADRVTRGAEIGPVSSAAELVQRQGEDADGGPKPTKAIVKANIRMLPDEGSDIWDRAQAVFVHLHGDEGDALATAASLLKERNVVLLYLEKQEAEDNRDVHIGFDVGKGDCTVDPNRMFTDDGISKTLKCSNCTSEMRGMAKSAITEFSRALFEQIERARKPRAKGGEPLPVIGLHNNTDRESLKPKDQGGDLSIKNLKGKITAAKRGEARLVSEVGTGEFKDQDSFVLTTRPGDFDRLKGTFNVVAQGTDNPDDGSLSVRIIRSSGAHGAKPDMPNEQYFNVETQSSKDGGVSRSSYLVNYHMVQTLLDTLGVAARPDADQQVLAGSVAAEPRLSALLKSLQEQSNGKR